MDDKKAPADRVTGRPAPSGPGSSSASHAPHPQAAGASAQAQQPGQVGNPSTKRGPQEPSEESHDPMFSTEDVRKRVRFENVRIENSSQLIGQPLLRGLDELDLQVRIWVSELKQMTPEQQLFARKAINDVLFEGLLGQLTRDPVTVNRPGGGQKIYATGGNEDEAMNNVLQSTWGRTRSRGPSTAFHCYVEHSQCYLKRTLPGNISSTQRSPFFSMNSNHPATPDHKIVTSTLPIYSTSTLDPYATSNMPYYATVAPDRPNDANPQHTNDPASITLDSNTQPMNAPAARTKPMQVGRPAICTIVRE